MEALKRLTLALTVALAAAACGGDDSGGPSTPSLDAGTGRTDASIDARVIPTTITLPDGGPLPCSATTPPANGKCGGSSCEQTEAELTASVKTGAKCGKPVEVSAFCSLSAVNTVTTCSQNNISFLPNQLDMFASSTKTCAQPKVDPTFSEGCLDCFVASARCAAEKCLSQCAATTASPACDACRIVNGCIKQFYDCAGYGDPLDPINQALGL